LAELREWADRAGLKLSALGLIPVFLVEAGAFDFLDFFFFGFCFSGTKGV
jgi:hypothetical protein